MSKYATKTRSESLRDYMTLDELVDAAPIPATEAEPASIQGMLRPHSGMYIQSETKPTMEFGTQEIPWAPGIWRILGSPQQEDILTAIPGREQIEVDPKSIAPVSVEVDGTEGYRPPWVDLEFLPRLAPFRSPVIQDHVFMEPMAQEAQRLTYPWRTIGMVFSNGVPAGSGVLVGPNLMLTASHVAPWGRSPWSMEFVPGFRMGDRPFGSSFVSQYRGIRPTGEVNGYDYVICRLYTPLGQGLGWMGSHAWSNWDEYTRRRYFCSGYPDTFGGRPAVELDRRIVDIDGDDPGLELEISHVLTYGFSGGPLWLPNEGPLVVGTVSGSEKDGLDPRRDVISGGFHMVDLIKFGLNNWPL